MKVKKSIEACFIALFLLISTGNASVVTFEFSGEVTQVPLDEVVSDLISGDPVEGSVSLDTPAADLIPGDPATGSFSWDAPLGVTVRVGVHDFNASGRLSIGILNRFVDDYLVLNSGDGETQALGGLGSLSSPAVSEPSTGGLLLAGSILLALGRCGRTSSFSSFDMTV